MATPPQPTELIHMTYEGNFQLVCEATVVNLLVLDDDGTGTGTGTGTGQTIELQLDRTTMHPQGGGQPSDVGTIVFENGKDDDGNPVVVVVSIHHVLLDRSTGVVTHSGSLDPPNPILPIGNGTGIGTGMGMGIGSLVKVTVDEAHRSLLAECHTGGHVVDSAMNRCGYDLPATKGYHFLDGPYVEYKGTFPNGVDKNVALVALQEAFQEVLKDDITTEIQTYEKADAEALCTRLALNFDFSMYDEQVRMVTVGGLPCPCGGTHVKSTSDLIDRGWEITGLKAKKGVVRVKYSYQKK